MESKMSEEAKAARNEYYRKYRANPQNKERIKQTTIKYWERKVQEAKEQTKE